MVTINLTPIERTCKVDDTDREYNVMRNSKVKNPQLVILILSAPNNLGKRDTVRNTWLKLYDKDNENRDVGSFKIKHYFVIGSLGLNADQLLHLSSEQSEFNDILILPIYDSYKTLTEKVKRSFEWLNDQYDYGLGFKYVLKCDDDSFVNLKTLPEEINAIENTYLTDLDSSLRPALQETEYLSVNLQVNDRHIKPYNLNIYWGYFSGSARIKSRGKWKESSWIAADRYVPYAVGGGYILSKDLVTFIARNAKDLRSFNSEDVSVGFWLGPVNNVLRIHDIRFDTEWTSRGCRNFYLIIHNVSQQEMRIMYKIFLESKLFCLEEIEIRSHYVYNWSAPPSQCCKPFSESVIKLQ
ncbi:hypothetical protein NQ317_009666 [Molorchus minor]|uniref:Hexosyltransferase n=1 Tax=Molorchus minor TaxID=1323400 RepID=A0ABQ9JJP5_9CUCU|nr:hypothetical protein NQ317_009666 [Molorchus minor]